MKCAIFAGLKKPYGNSKYQFTGDFKSLTEATDTAYQCARNIYETFATLYTLPTLQSHTEKLQSMYGLSMTAAELKHDFLKEQKTYLSYCAKPLS